MKQPPTTTLFPYTTLFRSVRDFAPAVQDGRLLVLDGGVLGNRPPSTVVDCTTPTARLVRSGALSQGELRAAVGADRKSTRLNSSHPSISYAVFCLKKK